MIDKKNIFIKYQSKEVLVYKKKKKNMQNFTKLALGFADIANYLEYWFEKKI